MKAESRIAFNEDGTVYDEAECPNCGKWVHVTADQSIGKLLMKCPKCHWEGYVGREAA